MSRSLFLTVFLIACAPFEPAADGTWDITNSRIVSDTCGVDPTPADGTSSIDLMLDSNGELRTGEVTCSLDGKAFTCPEVVYEEGTGEGWVVFGGTTLTGEFSTDTKADITIDARVWCEGTTCDGAASSVGYDAVPCDVEQAYEVEHAGPPE